jgi:hypothetical protein
MDMSMPVIVPLTTLPFLSSRVIDSLLSFIRKRTSFIVDSVSEENRVEWVAQGGDIVRDIIYEISRNAKSAAGYVPPKG